MWPPSQVHRLAGGQHLSHQCRLLNTRPASLSSHRHIQRLLSQPKLPFKSCSRHQRIVQNQADASKQASVVLTAPADVQQASTQPSAQPQPRSVVISVDYTSDADQAVQWALDYLIKPGDDVHLVHVLCNPRFVSPEVGGASGSYSRSPSFAEVQEQRSFTKRMEQQELERLQQCFAPKLEAANVPFQVQLPVQKGQKSAQAIGEALCQTASHLNAAVMLIASHGTGVLADYGSVANYCSQNSKAPVLMIPPNVAALKSHQPGNLMVVALADIAGLQKVASYTLNNLYQPGDTINTTYVEDTSDAGEASPSQHGLSDQMEEAAKGWFTAGPQDKVNFNINLMVAPGPLESSDLDLGEEICAKADELEARAVVLLHHGKGMMKEMVFGSITSFATRNCKRPLIVYYS